MYTETIHRFLTLYRHLRQHSQHMQEEGLSGRKIAMLRYLHEAGPQTIGQLAGYLYISDSSVSELVDRLQEQAFVIRARSPADNRVVIVTLSESGREVAQKPPSGGIPLLRERLQRLPPERLAVIHQALGELLSLLEIPDEH